VEPNGADIRQLTHDGHDDGPKWSPTGRQLVFTRDNGGYSRLMVMNADGSGVRMISIAPYTALDPSWSPDGVTVVFVDVASQLLYTINVDAAHKAPNTLTYQSYQAFGQTAWSRAGTGRSDHQTGRAWARGYAASHPDPSLYFRRLRRGLPRTRRECSW
jgi:Tol biopolymer transport system component